MIFLDTLFDEFCKYLDGKLSWSESKDKEWTETVFGFFSQKNKLEIIPFKEAKEYMSVDYIWRYDPNRYSTYDIELVVEHEGQEKDVETLISEEVQHLVDIKAKNKIGIFYPRLGDEKDLIEKIKHKIRSQSNDMKLPYEKFLIILGYATTRNSRRCILFKGFTFNNQGEIENQMERIIFQKTKRLVKIGYSTNL
jgi:hypothetical protein